MKERPILFSTPMVRAIMDGRKTQTRRIVKPQPVYAHGEGRRETYEWRSGLFALRMYPATSTMLEHCPYGKPGDRLWVRETWGTIKNYDHLAPRELPAGRCSVGYRTDPPGRWCQTGCGGAAGRWRPSIHMPRWVSRITLELTDVRVERLQNIDESDAWREGVEPATAGIGDDGPLKTHRTGFVRLWNELNAKRAPWASNPWVWVVSFRQLPTEGNEDD